MNIKNIINNNLNFKNKNIKKNIIYGYIFIKNNK